MTCRTLEHIGAGQFGEVCRAQWAVSGGMKDVAVKTLRAESSEEDKVRFLQEAAIMGQFFHPNIVKLYGVVTVGEPVSHEVTNTTRQCSYYHAPLIDLGYDLY